jgi:hypothetical protein
MAASDRLAATVARPSFPSSAIIYLHRLTKIAAG